MDTSALSDSTLIQFIGLFFNILVVILPGHFSTVKVIPLKMMVNQFWDVISIFEWCNWQCFVCHLNIVWLGLSFVWPFKYRMFHTYILQSFIKLLFLCPLCWTFCKIYLIMFTRTGIPSLWTSNSACLWQCEACHEIFNSQPLGTPWDVHFKTENFYFIVLSLIITSNMRPV